ncbi:MAG: HEAT repeat domain-containing protein [Thermodesulfovibrionales bacterium]
MTDTELRDMLIEYMGKGFLDNIIDMFKHDKSLFRFLPEMVRSDNTRVRIGAIALIEELMDSHREEIEGLVSRFIEFLREGDATLRGDIAYILGIIKSPLSVDVLKGLLNDENPDVRLIAREALEEFNRDES